MSARQWEHMDTDISVCNGLIDLKLQEVCSNKHINRIIYYFSFIEPELKNGNVLSGYLNLLGTFT